MAVLQRHEVKIASGQTTSGVVRLVDEEILAIEMPATFTGTALTFTGTAQASADITAVPVPGFKAVADSSGAAISLTVAQNKYVVLTGAHKDALSGLAYVKVISGSTEGADRVLAFVTRPRVE